ncbi:oligosaccharide flippase family protein [Demequina sp. NBRC 110051]|uniref:oligosaccharide flippase family protein n=1 Tax=Demequina sp. NBRC 110051 TaxID=1570340 RepID=UPI000A06EE21|nr:oligosaccharide flippase family protein [Demequina sp. NBRC 110051]
MAHESANLATRGARGALVTVIGQAVSVASKLLALAILARLLSPEVYGVMAVATAIQTLGIMVATLGIPLAIAQAPTVSRTSESTLFFASVVGGIVVGLFLWLAAPGAGALWSFPALPDVLRWLAISPVLGAGAAFVSMKLARDLRFSAAAAIEAISTAASFALAVVLAWNGQQFTALVAQAVAFPLIQLLLGLIVARWLPGMPRWPSAEDRALLRSGLHMFGINALRQLSRYVVAPVLALVAPVSHVGLFDRAQQLVVMPLTLSIEQMRPVALPVLARVRHTPDRLSRYFLQAQQLTSYGTATLFAVIAATADPLVALVFGPQWSGAVLFVQILALGAIPRALGLTMQWLHMGGGAAAAGLRFNAWALPLQVAITLAGLPWGAAGLAVANGIGWLVYWPLATMNASRAVGIRPWPLLRAATQSVGLVAVPTGVAAAFASRVSAAPLLSIAAGLGAATLLVAILAATVPKVRKDAAVTVGLLRASGRNRS